MGKKQKNEKRVRIEPEAAQPPAAAAVVEGGSWPGGSSKVLLLSGAVLAIIVTFVIYGQTLNTPAIQYEDTFYLLRSPYVAVADPLSHLGAVWKDAYFANFHPLTTTTWLIDRTFADKTVPFDAHPFRSMHFVYVAAGSALLILLFRQLGLAPILAVLGALLFAAHPAKTEVGGWLSARKDAIVLITATLAFASYLRARKSTTVKAWWFWHALTVILNLAAVLSKPVAVVLPALFIAWEFCADRANAVVRTLGLTAILAVVGGPLALILSSSLANQPSSSPLLIAAPIVLALALILAAPNARRLRAFVEGSDNGLRVLGPPMAVHAVVFASGVAWTIWAQSAVGAIKGGLSLIPTLNLTFDVLLSYTAKMFVPLRLSASYTWLAYPYVSAMGLAGAVVVLGLAALGLVLARRADLNLRLIAFGIFWFFICFIPVANLTPTGTKMADRYLMLPSIGAILAVCGACSWIAANRRTRQIAVLSVLLLTTAAYTVMARQRTAVWVGANPDVSIWAAAVETDPHDFLAMTNLATVYLAFKPAEADKAIDLLRRALEIAEGQMKIADGKTFDTSQITEGLADAYLAKARANANRQKEFLTEALKYYERANRNPRAVVPIRVRFLRNMADVQEQLAQTETDAAQRETLRSGAVKSLEEARRVIDVAGRSNYDFEFRETLLSFGTTYFGRGNIGGPEQATWYRKALDAYTEAATLLPDDARPVLYVGLCHQRLRLIEPSAAEKKRLFDLADAAFRRALTLRADFQEYQPLMPYRALATLYAEAGDYRTAIGFLKTVREKDPAYSQSSGADRDIQTLEQYVKGR